MNEIVKKYYTKEILKEACKKFGLAISEAKLIRANSNLIYDCGDKILRLSHSAIRNYDDIEVEIDWIKYLKENKLSVVQIIKSKENKEIEKIGTKDHFTIVCFEKISGAKISEANWNELHFQKLGKLVGLLHKVGQGYSPKTNLNYKNWDEIDEYKNHIYLDEKYSPIHDKLVTEFKSYPKLKESYGLIHYDIHHGNYLMSGEKIVLFDFEMVCNSWYANDIAAVVYYAKHFPPARKEENFEDRFLSNFWLGYDKEFKIERKEKEKILKFLLYRDLLVLGFVNKIWDLTQLEEAQRVYINMIEESISKRKVNLSI